MQLKEILTPQEINTRVKELGTEISRDFAGQQVLAVCILKGAFIFFADLLRELTIDPEIDFVRMSSYGDRDTSSGQILFTKDIEKGVRDKNILIVEDIVDTGLSLSYFKDILYSRGANQVKICALIDKYERREVQIHVDYPGFTLHKGFLVGFGLDFAEQYRRLPGINEMLQDQEE